MNTYNTISSQTVLLIGAGRLAKHLQHWNSLLENPHTLLFWNRQFDPTHLAALVERADIIWLAISDRSLVSFYENHLAASKKPVVHFSGALSDERLLGAHPLMSFPHELLPDEAYAGIHFVIHGRTTLQEILPGFTNRFTALNSENKPLYHALCVLAGNFPQLLWNQVAGEMRQLGLPPEALDSYIAQITANYLRLKEKSLTGPLIRGDHVTIEKNIQSLQTHPKLHHIYQAFNREFSA